MQVSQGTMGRVFVLRLEDGERIPDVIEAFALEKCMKAALVVYVGGAADGSKVVVGPEGSKGDPIVPMIHTLQGIQEAVGVGTLFPDDAGRPVLHLHAATGREGRATVGCTRAGVEVWLIGEVILVELLGIDGRRQASAASELKLLQLR
jgi:uncharacterized protein